jgi:hypothetical protein
MRLKRGSSARSHWYEQPAHDLFHRVFDECGVPTKGSRNAAFMRLDAAKFRQLGHARTGLIWVANPGRIDYNASNLVTCPGKHAAARRVALDVDPGGKKPIRFRVSWVIFGNNCSTDDSYR